MITIHSPEPMIGGGTMDYRCIAPGDISLVDASPGFATAEVTLTIDLMSLPRSFTSPVLVPGRVASEEATPRYAPQATSV